jgi:hypothetical protein
METRALNLLTQAAEGLGTMSSGSSQYEHMQQNQISNHHRNVNHNHILGTSGSASHHQQGYISDGVNNSIRIGNMSAIHHDNVVQNHAHRVQPQSQSHISQHQLQNGVPPQNGMTNHTQRTTRSGVTNELEKAREHLRREKESFDEARRMESVQSHAQQFSHVQQPGGYAGISAEYQHSGYWNVPITAAGGGDGYFYGTAGERHGVDAQQQQRHQGRGFGEERAGGGNGYGDLGILSAETFDDGQASRMRSTLEKNGQTQGQRQSTWGYITDDTPAMCGLTPMERLEGSMSADSSPNVQSPGHSLAQPVSTEEQLLSAGKRKKRKAKAMTSPGLDEEDEASKKARGRPRVDPKDETPAEVCSSLLPHLLTLLIGPTASTNTDPSSTASISKSKGDDHHIAGRDSQTIERVQSRSQQPLFKTLQSCIESWFACTTTRACATHRTSFTEDKINRWVSARRHGHGYTCRGQKPQSVRCWRCRPHSSSFRIQYQLRVNTCSHSRRRHHLAQ